METISVEDNHAKLINNMCQQILCLETPEDRLRAAITTVMFLNSMFEGNTDSSKESINHLRHLCNVLIKDVSSVEWNHPLNNHDMFRGHHNHRNQTTEKDEDIYVDTSNPNYPMSGNGKDDDSESDSDPDSDSDQEEVELIEEEQEEVIEGEEEK